MTCECDACEHSCDSLENVVLFLNDWDDTCSICGRLVGLYDGLEFIRHLLLQQQPKRQNAATCYECAWLDSVLEVVKRRSASTCAGSTPRATDRISLRGGSRAARAPAHELSAITLAYMPLTRPTVASMLQETTPSAALLTLLSL